MRTFTLILSLAFGLGLGGCGEVIDESESIRPSIETNNIAESNLHLGVAYLQRGEYEKALSRFFKALEADKNYPPTYNALGVLYQQLGDRAKSEEYFLKSLDLNSQDPSTLNNYGQFLCYGSRYDEAEVAFMKAVKNPLYPTPEIALSNAGICALAQDKWQTAELHFRNALKRNPKIPVALLQMAKISYTTGSYMSARAYLQRYLEIQAHSEKSLWLGIRIENELGDKNSLASYKLLLKNKFSDSREAKLLYDSLHK